MKIGSNNSIIAAANSNIVAAAENQQADPLENPKYVKAANAKGVSLSRFVKFANDVMKGGDDLIKFYRNDKGLVRMRVPSIETDGFVARDIKGALYRTDATKSVNNNVRATFVNALIDTYGDMDLKNIRQDVLVQMKLDDFIGSSKRKSSMRGDSFKLSDLAKLMDVSGTGKPLSASRIIAISNAFETTSEAQQAKVERAKVKEKQRTEKVLNNAIRTWKSKLPAILDDPDLDPEEKHDKFVEMTSNICKKAKKSLGLTDKISEDSYVVRCLDYWRGAVTATLPPTFDFVEEMDSFLNVNKALKFLPGTEELNPFFVKIKEAYSEAHPLEKLKTDNGQVTPKQGDLILEWKISLRGYFAGQDSGRNENIVKVTNKLFDVLLDTLHDELGNESVVRKNLKKNKGENQIQGEEYVSEGRFKNIDEINDFFAKKEWEKIPLFKEMAEVYNTAKNIKKVYNY